MRIDVALQIAENDGVPENVGAVSIISPGDDPFLRLIGGVMDAICGFVRQQGGDKVFDANELIINFTDTNEVTLVMNPRQVFGQLYPPGTDL